MVPEKMEEREWRVDVELRGGEQRGMQIRCQALFDHAFYFLFKITSTAKSMKGTEGNLDRGSSHPRDPGIEPRSPVLQADSLPSEPPGKPLLKVEPLT